MPTIKSALHPWPSISVALSLCGWWLGERVVPEDTWREIVLFCAIGFWTAGWFGRGWQSRNSVPSVRRILRIGLWSYLALLVGALAYVVAYYVLPSDESVGRTLSWGAGIVLIVLAIFVTAALEWAAAAMRAAGLVEERRYQAAGLGALHLGFGACALVLLNIAVHLQNLRVDLTHETPNAPSAATSSLVQAADDDVHMYLFFRPGSSVQSLVQDYALGMEAVGARVRFLDQAFDPALSSELKVTRNGTVAFRYQNRVERIVIGEDEKAARRQLRKLDEEVRTRLAKLARPPAQVYFTVGHGERALDGRDGEDERSANRLSTLLETLNVGRSDLGVASGLAHGVPDDADLVVIFGPTEAFMKAEVDSLLSYLDGGGSIWLLLEPGVPHGLDRLLARLGLTLSTAALANDQEYVRLRYEVSDRGVLFASDFTSHPVTRSLQRANGKAALLFQSPAAIEPKTSLGTETSSSAGPTAPGGIDQSMLPAHKVRVVARARPATFADPNRNFHFDPEEAPRQTFGLIAAVEWRALDPSPMVQPIEAVEGSGRSGGRALVVGDADVCGDAFLKNQANSIFAYESMLWLLHDDSLQNAFDVKQEGPLRHTRSQDRLWFYSTTILVPLLLVLGGMYVRHRRRSRGGRP